VKSKRKTFRLASRMPLWKKIRAREMAKNMTRPERILWSHLRNRKLDARFYKQRPLLGYIADFWCPSANLVVEVDGPCHLTRKAYDAYRDMVFKSRRGITTMRFTDQEIYNNLPAVVALIVNRIGR
jgi:very-short-patch-repair endonuclease